MIEFVQSYGLWIALAGVFVAMHWFGKGCCGGHQHESTRHEGRNPTQGPSDAKPVQSGTKAG